MRYDSGSGRRGDKAQFAPLGAQTPRSAWWAAPHGLSALSAVVQILETFVLNHPPAIGDQVIVRIEPS